MATLIDLAGLPWESWHGLEATRFKLVFSSDRTSTEELTFGLAELEPGKELPRHRHEEAEVYVILSGEGMCEVDGEEHRLQGGLALHIPSGAPHRTLAHGQEPLRWLFAFAADGFDDIRYRRDTSEAVSRRPGDGEGSDLRQFGNDPELNNPDATPGTGMLPDLGSDDPNAQPSG
ncbi:cupin domain-containing protein [Stappia indica]|uniref:cupin domain-containing protein n=1 Tax=Stappia indica TaxID=538381 RepID=UPI0008333A19|nr:cupin domain-containing protein [Stappia indica]